MSSQLTGTVVLEAQLFADLLRRAADGENRDALIAEVYANAFHGSTEEYLLHVAAAKRGVGDE